MIVTNTTTGCSRTTTNATVVTVNSLPAATITPQGPTTFCAGGSVVLQANTGAGLSYKWKKSGNLIAGATLSNYTATTAGNYKAEVTNSSGCTKLSAAITVTVPCKDGEQITSYQESLVSIYPNPAQVELNISLNTNENYEIDIVNMIGEKIISVKNQKRIDISALLNGIYILKVVGPDFQVNQKFVKE